MSGEDDYCDLCDLPRSTCVHGMPKPVVVPDPPKPARKPREPKPRKAAVTKQSNPVTTRAAAKPRRWSAPSDLAPHIVAMLDEVGGSLPSDEALALLEERVSDQLRPGDHETSPQGEQRWRTAARRARRELVTSGVLDGDQPGMWKLR